MMSMKREKLMVAAIENGTVIDHIPSNRLFEVIRLLRIEELEHDTVFISEQELNSLAVVAPKVTLSIIRDFEVTEKRCVELPYDIVNIVKCNNPKCICNNEPMPTRFIATDNILKCYYCEKEQQLSTVKLVETL